MDGLLQDLRLATRYLLKGGVVPLLAVLCLGLGIGLNTGMFTLLRGVLYRDIPIDEPDRVVWVSAASPVRGEDVDEITLADVTALRETGALSALEVIRGGNGVLTDREAAERVEGFLVTPGLFPMLGVQPQLGRGFLPDEAAEGGLGTVALISDALWRNRYGADPAIVGSTIDMNGRPLEVVGVMPERFGFPDNGDVWLPLGAADWTDASQRSVAAVGRLAPGVTLDEVRARAAIVSSELARARPETHRGYELLIQDLRESMIGSARGMYLMMGAVGLVLLIACVNVANLMLARAGERGREVAVRAALGATRARVVRQLLTEALVLAAAGALVGWSLALWFVDAALARIPEELPYWMRFDVDGPVLLFTIGLTVATALLFGTMPALQASRLDLSSRMGGRGHVGGAGSVRGGLVGLEVALSLILLVGAGLLTRSSLLLTRADIGLPTESILSMRVALAGEAYAPVAPRIAFVSSLAERLGGLPEVTGAAVTTSIPADDGGATGRVRANAGDPLDAAPTATLIGWTGAGPGTIGAEMLAGRGFIGGEAVDTAAAVAIVGRTLAERLWGSTDPVGRRVLVEMPMRAEVGSPGGVEERPLRVLGVVEDLVYEELGEETPVSRLQIHVTYASMRNRTLALLVRGRSDPAGLTPAVRGQLRALDPTLAPYEVMTMSDRRRLNHWENRLLGGMFAQLGVVALVLAGAGVYGVIAYGVARRRRELGVRLVLGASPRGLVGSVVRATAIPTVIGGAAGLIGAWWLGRLLEGILYGVEPGDPITFVAAGSAMLGVALLAAFLPARRALRLDPADALRAE